MQTIWNVWSVLPPLISARTSAITIAIRSATMMRPMNRMSSRAIHMAREL